LPVQQKTPEPTLEEMLAMRARRDGYLTPEGLVALKRKKESDKVLFNKIDTYFPDEGPFRRELYPKQMEFFAAGATFRERAAISSNRSGKSESGAFEAACHLTGRYPKWWKGRKFDKPISAWAVGTTNETTREVVQEKLLGRLERKPGDIASDVIGLGTGMVPKQYINHVDYNPQVRGAVKSFWVDHMSGGRSVLYFKSFEQGREAFEGSSRDLIWMDEEVPMDIYLECLTRTATTNGIVYLTFTPLRGLSDVVLLFMPDGEVPAEFKPGGRHVTQWTWEDVPHLDAKVKAELLASYPPHQRDARTKGRPSLGQGAIFPVEEDKISVAPFEIPKWWPRCYGMDVGLRTAAMWAAKDPSSNIIYFYREYYREEAEPGTHAAAIKAPGSWIPGVIDPASRGRTPIDGRRLIDMYRNLGLQVTEADNTVGGGMNDEAGLYSMWEAMEAGNFKVFSTLTRFWREFRLYRRDVKGRVVKKDDELVDCARYVWNSGRNKMKQQTPPRAVTPTSPPSSWMT
jgi:phage terminase large subunit-like protein